MHLGARTIPVEYFILRVAARRLASRAQSPGILPNDRSWPPSKIQQALATATLGLRHGCRWALRCSIALCGRMDRRTGADLQIRRPINQARRLHARNSRVLRGG